MPDDGITRARLACCGECRKSIHCWITDNEYTTACNAGEKPVKVNYAIVAVGVCPMDYWKDLPPVPELDMEAERAKYLAREVEYMAPIVDALIPDATALELRPLLDVLVADERMSPEVAAALEARVDARAIRA